MSEQSSPTETYKKPKFRSPPYPYIPLGKSIERASEIYQQAQHHLVPKHVLASCWGYGMKSSGLVQTAAALKQFGLLRDQGSKEQRRFQLTDEAIRILADPDAKSIKRVNAIKQAALAPVVYATLWEKYGVSGLSGSMDNTMISYLTLDMKDEGSAPYSPKSAKEVLDGYKKTISYSGLTLSDILGDDTQENSNSRSSEASSASLPEIKIGDWIQREKEGVFTFPTAQKVRHIDEQNDMTWVFIENSESGIPIDEIVLQKKSSQIAEPLDKPPVLSLQNFSDGTVENDIDTSTWKEVTNIDDGVVTLIMPANISEQSYHDLNDWVELILKKAKRRAGV